MKKVEKSFESNVKPWMPDREDWVNVDREARRWGVSEQQVVEMVEKVEEEKSLEVTLKMKRRNNELLEYFRVAHDREVQKRMCTWDGCTSGPWDTWGEMAAHVRMHLVMDSGDEKNVRQTLKDTEELINPSSTASVKVSVPESQRDELLSSVVGGIRRKLDTGSDRKDESSQPTVISADPVQSDEDDS